MRRALAAICVLAPAFAAANGRAPATNGVYFKPGDTAGVYVSTTFGLFVSPDSCHFYWLCEDDVGFGGIFDPIYRVTATGAILASTYHGLRVSHDGGCSFTTATADIYVSSVEVSPNGDIWIGTSNNAGNNSLFVSTNDAASFTPIGALPASGWYTSIRVAPSDPMRVYTGSYQIATAFADAETPPAAHLFRSDDGATFNEMPLSGITYGSVPQIAVEAVDPTDPNILYLVSHGANGPSGDRLYRSSDGGASFVDALQTKYAISDVVVRDAQTVLVSTQYDTSFRSTDRGMTFAPLAGAPLLACLGQRSDGVVFGCATDSTPDFMALATTTDANTWRDALRFEYITGPLACPAGTTEHDVCDAQMWSTFAMQFGITASACAAGPDGVTDGPPVDPSAPPKRGCCDAGGQPSALVIALAVAMVVGRRRR